MKQKKKVNVFFLFSFFFLTSLQILFSSATSLFVLSVCVCGCLHGNDVLAAVAQTVVLILSLGVLIYCENESESGRLRERERIIMFPLLSRLPQLSPKRGSRSRLLIHLQLCNNRTPQFPSIYLSLSLVRSLLFFHSFFSHFSKSFYS